MACVVYAYVPPDLQEEEGGFSYPHWGFGQADMFSVKLRTKIVSVQHGITAVTSDAMFYVQAEGVRKQHHRLLH